MLNAENAQKPVRLIKRTEKYKGHVITVYEDHLDFEFKSGLETEVQM